MVLRCSGLLMAVSEGECALRRGLGKCREVGADAGKHSVGGKFADEGKCVDDGLGAGAGWMPVRCSNPCFTPAAGRTETGDVFFCLCAMMCTINSDACRYIIFKIYYQNSIN